MEVISPAPNVSNRQAQQTPDQDDALRGLALDGFLKLMIVELQNQDPLNPMENSEILAQISQIREIEATANMTDVLESVATSIDGIALGQRIAGASGLIGRYIEAEIEVTSIPVDGQTEAVTETKTIQGLVDRVSFNGDEPVVYVDGTAVRLSQILDVAKEASGLRELETDNAAETSSPADDDVNQSVVAQGLEAVATLQSKLAGLLDDENSAGEATVSRADILRLLAESADQEPT